MHDAAKDNFATNWHHNLAAQGHPVTFVCARSINTLTPVPALPPKSNACPLACECAPVRYKRHKYLSLSLSPCLAVTCTPTDRHCHSLVIWTCLRSSKATRRM